MHASIRVGNTTVLASDGRCQGQPSFQGISLSLTAADEAEAERLSLLWPMVGMCRCRSARPSFPRFRHGCRPLWCVLDHLGGNGIWPASAYPIFRTPASICFSEPNNVFIPGWIAGTAGGFASLDCAAAEPIMPNWAAAMALAAVPKKRRR